MKWRAATLVTILAAVLALPAALAEEGNKKGSIPDHPSKLTFEPLDYKPPKAADYRRDLKGGAVAFMVEDHSLPLVTVNVRIRVGSYLDPQGKEGLASMTGELMRSGGAAGRTAQEFDEQADFLATQLGSSIGSTFGSATVNTIVRNLDTSLEMFFGMLRNPGFQQDRIDLSKNRRLQSMERRNDRSGAIEGREWNRLMRGEGHYTARQTTKSSIDSLTRGDLLAFHKKYVHPANFIFAISGDFDSDDMQRRLEKAMEGWESGLKAPPIPRPQHKPAAGLYVVDKPEVNQGRFSIGHIGIERNNPDRYAVEMMNDILGGSGFTSRITNRVRSDEGLAYSAGSSYSPGTYYPGVFRGFFQSKTPTCAQAVHIILEEIDRIRNEKVSEQELETVKNSAIETFPRSFSSASTVAGTFARDEFSGRPSDYWEKYRDRIRAVTVDDVQRMARKYLHPDKLVILAVGDAQGLFKGNPDRPEFDLRKLAPGGKPPVMIPLPDPLTMAYPSGN